MKRVQENGTEYRNQNPGKCTHNNVNHEERKTSKGGEDMPLISETVPPPLYNESKVGVDLRQMYTSH